MRWNGLCWAPLAVAVGLAVGPLVISGSAAGQAASADGVVGADYRAPKDGGVRRLAAPAGTLLRRAPEADGAEAGDLPAGAILINKGCEASKGGFWCRVEALTGSVRGYADARDLVPAPGPDGVVARGLDDSRSRAVKGRFDETGVIPCAQEQGQDLATCKAGVARGTGGDATLIATFGNGFARRLSFVHGTFAGASATMSGTGRDRGWRIEDGVYLIRVDDQRFHVPRALLFDP